MLKVTLDEDLIQQCRRLASCVVNNVEAELRGRSSVGVERAVFRLLGLNLADAEGRPLANLLVEHMRARGLLSAGAFRFAARAALSLGGFSQDEAMAVLNGAPIADASDELVAEWTQRQALIIGQDLAAIRAKRDALIETLPVGVRPWRYVIVATGDIDIDVFQAQLAAKQGADIIAVIRSTAQSLLDYIPDGRTHEGYGGTFATQANFRVMRQALDETSRELDRYIRLTNYASGLCMAEMAALGATERLDMMLSDSMYGVLFRDINMQRTFIDQFAARRLQGLAGIIINTGEDNYLTTADAFEAAHTVIASQFLNQAFARRAGLAEDLIGLGHAFEMNPAQEDGLLLQMADALTSRACFPDAPLKYMPPTRHMDGDLFQGQVLDSLFNLASVATGQTIHLVGVLTEAAHSPQLQDRFIALKNVDYVHRYARSFASEFTARPGGIMNRRAERVLAEAARLLATIEGEGMFEAIGRGAFGNVKRHREGGRGLDGVFEVSPAYLDPLGLLAGSSAPC